MLPFYSSFLRNKDIFRCNKVEVNKITLMDIITQLSGFKSKNNRTGLLLWDGMRKILINDYEAF